MTSDSLLARNRANAKKSTGPKTERGKAAVAGNARRHGATARPDPDSVATWLAVILDQPEITPSDLLPDDEEGYIALALAEAEVRVVMAERALSAFEAGGQEREDAPTHPPAQACAPDGAQTEDRGAGRQARSGGVVRRRVVHVDGEEVAPVSRRHRLLKRYLSEARAQRRRAFMRWVGGRGAG